MYYTEHPSPAGTLLLASTECGISGVYFPEHRHFAGIEGWIRDDARRNPDVIASSMLRTGTPRQ